MTLRTRGRRLGGLVVGRHAKVSVAALGTIAVSLGGSSFRLFVQAALSNWLGPIGYGQFVVMRGWGGLLSRLPNRGYNLALVRWLPHFERTDDPDAYRALVRQSVAATLIGSVVVSAVAWGVSIFLLGDGSNATLIGLMLISSVAAMTLFRQVLQASFRHVLGVTFTELVHPAVFAVLALAFALAVGKSVAASLLALVLAGCVVAVGEAIVVWRTIPQPADGTTSKVELRPAPTPLFVGQLGNTAVWETQRPIDKETAESREWRAGTLPLFVGQLGNAGLEVSYLLIVGAILGPRQAGIFAVAQRIAVLARMGNSAVESVIGPQFSRLADQGASGRKEMQRVVDRGIAASAVFTIAAVVALIAGSDLVLGLFGSGFADGRTVLWVLLMGNLVNAFSGPTGYLVSMSGSEAAWGYVMAGHAVVGAGLASIVAWRTGSSVDVAIVATVVTVSWNIWLIRIGGSKLGVWCMPKPVRAILGLGVAR